MSSTDFDRVLGRYRERLQRENDEWKTLSETEILARRDSYLLPVGEDVARLLQALVIARGATRVVELGTSYGFSTLFLPTPYARPVAVY